ncbi:hypothetical protein T265_00165 [Opisthorchis viverrini]|uniref:t-SNARE coiled-coil homology domain-containing protein n=1 Tax=Opisthorchis viverrini TaxID=6198 RepID=A0A075AK11_OPIVI|nr:hypothetical protein T265_00165 [Opisthorchis viverrini]KER34324.1 hypothetical protein T265_00165 [Opisthorchis viverrini]
MMKVNKSGENGYPCRTPVFVGKLLQGDMDQWLEREFTDRKVRSNPTSASRLPLSRLGEPGSIPTLELPSGDMTDDTIPPGGNGFRPAEIPETDTGLDEFFKEVEGIRESIDRIQNIISQLHIKHTEVLAAPQQNERTKQEIEELTDTVKNSAGQVRLKLKQLEQAIHEQEAKDPSVATVRVRRTQHSTITRRFMDVMAAYNKEQTDYRDACKAQIKLKLEIAECPRTDEELEQMLESDNPQIFTQGILMDTQQARQNAADIEARHEDILKLEKSIRELHELFIDLAALVDSQSELLDRIEYNVDATQDHITGAVIATKKAKEYQKKSRKFSNSSTRTLDTFQQSFPILTLFDIDLMETLFCSPNSRITSPFDPMQLIIAGVVILLLIILAIILATTLR